jgi:hypothetical protein
MRENVFITICGVSYERMWPLNRYDFDLEILCGSSAGNWATSFSSKILGLLIGLFVFGLGKKDRPATVSNEHRSMLFIDEPSAESACAAGE